MLAGVVALAGLTGFLITRSLGALASRREDEGASAGFFGLAIVGTLIVAASVIIAAYAFLDRLSS